MIADPLNIGETSKENIAWFRHAEIKHGRVAMIAFVGHLVQATGAHWPWSLTTSGVSFGDISAAGGPADQWDALPSASKLQILIAVGFLEVRTAKAAALERDHRRLQSNRVGNTCERCKRWHQRRRQRRWQQK